MDYNSGPDMWEEVSEFYEKAWQQRIEPFALAEFVHALHGYKPHDVREALRYIYRNQDRPFRPGIKKVKDTVGVIVAQEREREGGNEDEKYCKWCDNTKYFYVLMYIVTPDMLPEDFVYKPDKHKYMKRMYRYRDEFLVEPAVAKKKGLHMEERSLWCDRCQEANHEHGLSPIAAVRPFLSHFEGFFDYRGEEGRLGRILDDNPPRVRRAEVKKEIFDVGS